MARTEAKERSMRDWMGGHEHGVLPRLKTRYMIMMRKAPLIRPTSPLITEPNSSLKLRVESL